MAPTKTMDSDQFKLMVIEAMKDKSVVTALAKATENQMDKMTDRVMERLDATIKSYQEELRNKEKRIADLEEKVCSLEGLLDDQEQYSRRESLRFSGIAESPHECTDDLILDVVNKAMSVEPPLQREDIARSHRSGDKAKAKSGRRAILVRFATYRVRDRVIRARRNLKRVNERQEEKLFVNEDLTKYRNNLLYQARNLKKDKRIKDVWTWDGIIRVQDFHNRVHAVTRQSGLKTFEKPENTDTG